MRRNAAKDVEAYVADVQHALTTPLERGVPGLLPASHGRRVRLRRDTPVDRALARGERTAGKRTAAEAGQSRRLLLRL